VYNYKAVREWPVKDYTNHIMTLPKAGGSL
jgi:hypothetical protein